MAFFIAYFVHLSRGKAVGVLYNHLTAAKCFIKPFWKRSVVGLVLYCDCCVNMNPKLRLMTERLRRKNTLIFLTVPLKQTNESKMHVSHRMEGFYLKQLSTNEQF